MLDINDGINLVKFSATWCAPCKVVAKSIEKIKTEFTDVNFQEIDIDDNPTIAKEYKIKHVPTIIIFNNSEEILRFVGSVKIDILRKAIKDIVKI